MYDKDRFFCELFFLKIFIVFLGLRDVLVLYVVDINCNDLISMYVCILVLLFGNILKYLF